MLLSENLPLAPLTSLQLGGPAKLFAELHNEEDLIDALAYADAHTEKIFVLGDGSNTVVADEGFAGLVLHPKFLGTQRSSFDDKLRVEVGAGEKWDTFAQSCVEEGLVGVECLCGIPGQVGSTPIQNVGAYGQEVADTITTVRVYDRFAEEFIELDASDCGFGYRSSIFKNVDRWIVTKVTFEFSKSRLGSPIRYAELCRALSVKEGDRAPLRELRDCVMKLRKSKSMVLDPNDPESRSAGSFFVNPIISPFQWQLVEEKLIESGALKAGDAPPGFVSADGTRKLPAAWLIERSGFCKGFSKNGVGISSKHALALVNRGGTTTALLALAQEIRDSVQEKFGVVLKQEPVFLG